MLGHGLLVAKRSQGPGARRVGVGHRLQSGERLGGDDEQRLGGVEVAGGLDEVGGVDVGDEAEGELPGAVVAQGLIGHDRAEVRATDADVDDVADRPAGVAGPGAGADLLAEVGHAVEHGVDLLHHVEAVEHERGRAGHAQGDVQDGAVLRDVDGLPGEHGGGALGQAGLLGQGDKQAEGLVGDAVLGVVEVQAGAFGGEALASPGVGGEQVAQVRVLDLVVVA